MKNMSASSVQDNCVFTQVHDTTHHELVSSRVIYKSRLQKKVLDPSYTVGTIYVWVRIMPQFALYPCGELF
jgi:hypothetical protein